MSKVASNTGIKHKALPKLEKLGYTEEVAKQIISVMLPSELKAFLVQSKHIHKCFSVLVKTPTHSFEVTRDVLPLVSTRVYGTTGAFTVTNMDYFRLLQELNVSPDSVILL